MDRAAILAKLTELFREIFDDETLILTPETTADDVPGWDSMNHITIVVETERRFGVKFNTAEIEELKNIGEFIALIEKKTRR
jgi:acyl carrier protein